MRKGDFAVTPSGADFESLIDKAIDDLFQPHSAKKETTESTPAPAPEPSPALEASPKEPSLEISWEASSSVPPPATPPSPPPSFASQPAPAAPPVAQAVAHEEEEDAYEGMDEEDRGPSLAVVRPLHEKLLSLDWEINNRTISEYESALNDLEALSQANVHARTTIRMALITCKYLRASKSLATPLAIKFLRTVVQALDVFLAEAAPGRPSKDALVNDLMGLYNDMKEDANRLRAAALRRRSEEAAPTKGPAPVEMPSAAPATPPPPQEHPQPPPSPTIVGAVPVTESDEEEEIEELEPVVEPMAEPEVGAAAFAPAPGPIAEQASEMELLRRSVDALLNAVLRIEAKLDSLAPSSRTGA